MHVLRAALCLLLGAMLDTDGVQCCQAEHFFCKEALCTALSCGFCAGAQLIALPSSHQVTQQAQTHRVTPTSAGSGSAGAPQPVSGAKSRCVAFWGHCACQTRRTHWLSPGRRREGLWLVRQYPCLGVARDLPPGAGGGARAPAILQCHRALPGALALRVVRAQLPVHIIRIPGGKGAEVLVVGTLPVIILSKHLLRQCSSETRMAELLSLRHMLA